MPTTVRASEVGYFQQQVTLISDAQIGRFKAALHLRTEQERHWPAVAAALRHMRLGNRATTIAINALGLRRLVAAARPLFESMDDEQRQVALQLVQSLGFGPFAASL
jgi:hypothetical protein